jgi:hypothetical protein
MLGVCDFRKRKIYLFKDILGNSYDLGGGEYEVNFSAFEV